MSFADFMRDIPLIHSWDGGYTWTSGGFDRKDLESLQKFLSDKLSAGSVFLETGAGLSTITLLSLNPARFISIAPEAGLFERIRSTCQKFNISDTPLEAYVEESQWALPRLAAAHRETGPILDFVLIDGCHGWPTAFVDLEYSNAMLKQGGYIMIDDVQLHSLKEMARLLAKDPGFELAFDLRKALIFRKTAAERHFGEWCDQSYLAAQTEIYGKYPNPYALYPPSLLTQLYHRLRRLPGRAAGLLARK